MLKNRIKSLISLIEDTEIEEIEGSSFWGAQKIRLSKKKTNQNTNIESVKSSVSEISIDSDKVRSKDVVDSDIVISSNDSSDSLKDSVEELKKEDKNELKSTNNDIDCYELKAPLGGTFYSSPKPSDPPFINVGDKVTKGQVVCIIEAMKIFNDIESEINGIVHEICIENGNPVEYDQVIIKILPE